MSVNLDGGPVLARWPAAGSVFADGKIIAGNDPRAFFSNPQQQRTRADLGDILHHH